MCCIYFRKAVKKIGIFLDLVLYKGGGGGPKFFVFIGNHLFGLKTSRNVMKHIIISFKMKGDVISDHLLML